MYFEYRARNRDNISLTGTGTVIPKNKIFFISTGEYIYSGSWCFQST